MSILRNPFFDTSSSTAAGLEGPRGPTGPQGPQGIQGIQGEDGPQGPPGVGVWRGAWSVGTAYNVHDLVDYGGSTWIAIASGTGHQPDSSPTFWNLVAAKGDAGPTGAKGDTGAGVPAGGSAGQVLKKVSGTDFDTAWADIPVGVLGTAFAFDNTWRTINSGVGLIPGDDTVPQIGEGLEIMSLAYTPKSATSKLRLRVIAPLYSGSGTQVILALFRDGGVNAVAATHIVFQAANWGQNIILEAEINTGSTAATTISTRIGVTAAGQTVYVNGATGGRLFGGLSKATLSIEEVL